MASEWVAAGERAWQSREPYWGIWGIPEKELCMLPDDMTGLKAIELGCGTGYVSAWMQRRGARVTAIDNSSRQLATASRLAVEHRQAIELIHGDAEQVPCPDGHFDFALSEYGAAIWCDPHRWIPEAHRLLKPGGRLVFLGNSPLAMICMPENGDICDTRLHRSYFDLGRMDWQEVEIDPGGIEFNLSFSAWLRLFRETGFDVLDYLEIRAPATAPDETRFCMPRSWAREWPSEQVWKLVKRN